MILQKAFHSEQDMDLGKNVTLPILHIMQKVCKKAPEGIPSVACECWTLYTKTRDLCFPLWCIIFGSATIVLFIAYLDLWAPVCVRSANRVLTEGENGYKCWQRGWNIIFDLCGRDDLFNWIRAGGWPRDDNMGRGREMKAVPCMKLSWNAKEAAIKVWPFLKKHLPPCCAAGTVQTFCRSGSLPGSKPGSPDGVMPLTCSWLNKCAQVVEKTQLASAGMITCVLATNLISHAHLAKGAKTRKWTTAMDIVSVVLVIVASCLQLVLYLVWRMVREKGKQMGLAWRFSDECNRLLEHNRLLLEEKQAAEDQLPEGQKVELEKKRETQRLRLEAELLPLEPQPVTIRIVKASLTPMSALGNVISSTGDVISSTLRDMASKVDAVEFMKVENPVAIRKDTPPSLKAAGLLLALSVMVGKGQFSVDDNVLGNILTAALCATAGVLGHWAHAALDLLRHYIVFVICVEKELTRLLDPIGKEMTKIHENRKAKANATQASTSQGGADAEDHAGEGAENTAGNGWRPMFRWWRGGNSEADLTRRCKSKQVSTASDDASAGLEMGGRTASAKRRQSDAEAGPSLPKNLASVPSPPKSSAPGPSSPKSSPSPPSLAPASAAAGPLTEGDQSS